MIFELFQFNLGGGEGGGGGGGGGAGGGRNIPHFFGMDLLP